MCVCVYIYIPLDHLVRPRPHSGDWGCGQHRKLFRRLLAVPSPRLQAHAKGQGLHIFRGGILGPCLGFRV